MADPQSEFTGYVLNFKDDLPQHPLGIPYLTFALLRDPPPSDPNQAQPVLSVDLRKPHAHQCVSVIPFAWAKKAKVVVELDPGAGPGKVKRVDFAVRE